MTEKLAIIPKDLGEIEQFARVALDSTFFKDSRSIAQAMVKIQLGQEYGISPIQSMANIHVVQGKPVLSSWQIGAKVKEAGYRYKVKWEQDAVEVTFFERNGEEIGVSHFSIEKAKRAGLLNKDNWKKYPENMMMARALANGARWYCPDAILAYDPDELPPPTVEVEQKKTQKQQAIEAEYTENPAPQLPVETPLNNDDIYPGKGWHSSNRFLMGVANSPDRPLQKVTRDEIKRAFSVESLSEISGKDLRSEADVVKLFGFYRSELQKATTIEKLKTLWDSIPSGFSKEWKSQLGEAKDEIKLMLAHAKEIETSETSE